MTMQNEPGKDVVGQILLLGAALMVLKSPRGATSFDMTHEDTKRRHALEQRLVNVRFTERLGVLEAEPYDDRAIQITMKE